MNVPDEFRKTKYPFVDAEIFNVVRGMRALKLATLSWPRLAQFYHRSTERCTCSWRIDRRCQRIGEMIARELGSRWKERRNRNRSWRERLTITITHPASNFLPADDEHQQIPCKLTSLPPCRPANCITRLERQKTLSETTTMKKDSRKACKEKMPPWWWDFSSVLLKLRENSDKNSDNPGARRSIKSRIRVKFGRETHV